MDIFLQIWGGSFYLINKICFSIAEGSKAHIERQLKIAGWTIYILGVPAWVILLVGKNNWIAASIEAGGIPAMILGLYVIFHGRKPHKHFERLVSFCTYGSIVLGVSVSLIHNNGVTSATQILEFGVTIGFLMGSYLLAKQNNTGWIFFMLMNLSMAMLMMLQDKPILMLQQLLSLGFVLYGYYKALKSANKTIQQVSEHNPIKNTS